MSALDDISRRWAHGLGASVRQAHPYMTAAELAKACCFRADSEHHRLWMLGYQGVVLIGPAAD